MNDSEYLAWELRQYEKRKKTRNQKKRSRYELALKLAVIAWVLVICAVVAAHAHSEPEEGSYSPPAENAPEAIKTAFAEVEEEPEIYHREAISFYPVPLDHDLQSHIIHTCEDYGVDPAVVFAMIDVESDFRANVIGDGGDSEGLMQIQRLWHSERMERLGCDDLTDPYQNTTVGIDFLAELLETYSLEDALTAYNSGSPGESEYSRKVLLYMEGLKQ